MKGSSRHHRTGSAKYNEAPVVNTESDQNSQNRKDQENGSDPLDAIQTLSLEEVHLQASPIKENSGGILKKAPPSTSQSKMRANIKPKSKAIFNPQGASSDIVRSGHQDLNTLYASNDVTTGPITVNLCNAPNNSTVQCGCENINCPFCNLMMSIEQTDPSVLQ